MKNCGACAHHAINPQDLDQVFCRRYPPQVFLVPTGRQGQVGQMAAFPGVPRSWRCGEFLKTEASNVMDIPKLQ